MVTLKHIANWEEKINSTRLRMVNHYAVIMLPHKYANNETVNSIHYNVYVTMQRFHFLRELMIEVINAYDT